MRARYPSWAYLSRRRPSRASRSTCGSPCSAASRAARSSSARACSLRPSRIRARPSTTSAAASVTVHGSRSATASSGASTARGAFRLVVPEPCLRQRQVGLVPEHPGATGRDAGLLQPPGRLSQDGGEPVAAASGAAQRSRYASMPVYARRPGRARTARSPRCDPRPAAGCHPAWRGSVACHQPCSCCSDRSTARRPSVIASSSRPRAAPASRDAPCTTRRSADSRPIG